MNHNLHYRGLFIIQDLFSVMITGPERTPYEDGVFFFDMQLPPDYPKVPMLHTLSIISLKVAFTLVRFMQ